MLVVLRCTYVRTRRTQWRGSKELTHAHTQKKSFVHSFIRSFRTFSCCIIRPLTSVCYCCCCCCCCIIHRRHTQYNNNKVTTRLGRMGGRGSSSSSSKQQTAAGRGEKNNTVTRDRTTLLLLVNRVKKSKRSSSSSSSSLSAFKMKLTFQGEKGTRQYKIPRDLASITHLPRRRPFSNEMEWNVPLRHCSPSVLPHSIHIATCFNCCSHTQL